MTSDNVSVFSSLAQTCWHVFIERYCGRICAGSCRHVFIKDRWPYNRSILDRGGGGGGRGASHRHPIRRMSSEWIGSVSSSVSKGEGTWDNDMTISSIIVSISHSFFFWPLKTGSHKHWGNTTTAPPLFLQPWLEEDRVGGRSLPNLGLGAGPLSWSVPS